MNLTIIAGTSIILATVFMYFAQVKKAKRVKVKAKKN
jgi:hypothetical protein